MYTHGVARDGHSTRVDWIFFKDQFGEFFHDVSIHFVVVLPSRLCSINIKPCTSAKIPRLILSVNTGTTYPSTHDLRIVAYEEMYPAEPSQCPLSPHG